MYLARIPKAQFPFSLLQGNKIYNIQWNYLQHPSANLHIWTVNQSNCFPSFFVMEYGWWLTAKQRLFSIHPFNILIQKQKVNEQQLSKSTPIILPNFLMLVGATAWRQCCKGVIGVPADCSSLYQMVSLELITLNHSHSNKYSQKITCKFMFVKWFKSKDSVITSHCHSCKTCSF